MDKNTNYGLMSLFIAIALVSWMAEHQRKPVFHQRAHCAGFSFAIEESLPGPEHFYLAPISLTSGQIGSQSFAVEYYPLLPNGLNLNQASESLLTLIKGIGPKRAAQIVRERESGGKFIHLTDFFDRTGLRTDLLETARDWVYVGN